MVVKTNVEVARAVKPGNGMDSSTGRIRLQAAMESNVEDKCILIAKELKFVKTLAGNDVKLRRKVLKNLKTWLATRSRSTFAFSNSDFLRLWKGLFYCMWMSDKPLVQENLAEEIASLLKCFDGAEVSVQFFAAFLETMSAEWFGIDTWRIDKFMMLVRRCTRQMLQVLHEENWPEHIVESLMQQVECTVLNPSKCPFGLTKHFDDLFLEEIAKVSNAIIDPAIIHRIVRSYAIRLLGTNDVRLIKHIISSIFHSLLYQSELGQDFQEKFDLWKKTSFATNNINDVEFDVNYEYSSDVSEEAVEEETEKVYDPRAGQVDVVINEIKFDPLKIVEIFEENRFKSFVTSKGKKYMKMLVKQYKKFANGVFPLGIQTVESTSKKDYDVDIDEKVKELEKYQTELVGDETSNKKKKQRKHKFELKSQQLKPESKSEPETLSREDSNKSSEEREPEAQKSKKKKKASRMQLKEEKLKQLRLKREKKLEAIKRNKLPPKATKESSTVALEKKKHVIVVAKDANATETKTNPVKKDVSKGLFEVKDEWSKPLQDGEVELFIPSRKAKLMEIAKESELNTSLSSTTMVKNPFATPKNKEKSLKRILDATPTDESGKKRVKIALNKNVSQDFHQHMQQVKSSPQLPYDSSKKPSKGALKPNLMPSPINPFYKKKIGLKLRQ
ncbi:ribosomal RNA processing protein 1 homolog isoform X1 [Toxorhynchites rutilus septentrionalis]|uniref:ribosomal RNA processing protein 1 homolog isoform X1 n=1 Tax=Toxorhynchites rutilus septentrionalis TaxID=329112 RepID=UPI00247A3D63|nr:ribosomal RNA processing protein 1 homolog isoform X1 [Toxorhynchites rutilus septentrionalis]